GPFACPRVRPLPRRAPSRRAGEEVLSCCPRRAGDGGSPGASGWQQQPLRPVSLRQAPVPAGAAGTEARPRRGSLRCLAGALRAPRTVLDSPPRVGRALGPLPAGGGRRGAAADAVRLVRLRRRVRAVAAGARVRCGPLERVRNHFKTPPPALLRFGKGARGRGLLAEPFGRNELTPKTAGWDRTP